MKSLKSCCQFLSLDERGNVAVIFAMAVVPVALLAGGSVDVGNVYWQRTRLQVAADAAALAAVGPAELTSAARTEIASKMFTANAKSVNMAGITPTITVVGDAVTVEASIGVNTPFLSLMNISRLEAPVVAKASATTRVTDDNPGKVCLLALDPDSDDGIHLQGGNIVNYLECWAHTNSGRATAINASGSKAKAYGKGHCAVGGATQTHDTFSPLPKTGCRTVPDPFAHVGAYETGKSYSPKFTPPTLATTCRSSKLSLKKGTFTLDPGRYCGGLDIKAGATVYLNPGIYYIDEGLFNVQSGATIVGSNVLFYLAGASSRMQVIGGGRVELTGRTGTSSYAGFLVIAHPDANRGGESNIQGGGIFKLQGVIYMPTQRIEVSGEGDVNALDVSYFGMVAKDFYFRGNGVFNAKKHGGGPVPDIMPTMPVETIRDSVLQ